MACNSLYSHLILAMTLLLTAKPSLGQNPGFKLAVTATGLAKIDTVLVPVLIQQLANIDIPDVSGSTDAPVIGTIDYSLSSIKLSNLKIPTSDIKSGTAGVTVDATSISLDGHANWHYEQHSWPHISDGGSADLSVSSVSLSVSVVVNKDDQGHPTLKTTGCSLSIGHLGVTFHGGASWLYNLFDDQIADSIKSSLQGQICTLASGAINDQGNKAIESLPIIVKVDTTSEINYELLSNPIYTPNYIETQHKGEFFSITKPVEAPFTPAPIPAITTYDKMMYVWLTAYVANTAGFVYQTAGILQYNVTQDTIPSGFPIQLNTSFFKLLIPSLYQKYPNMAIILALNATRPPVLQIMPSSANLTVTGTVGIDVIQGGGKPIVNAFVLGLVVYTVAKVKVQVKGTNEVVSANCTLLKVDLSLVSSNIGTFDVSILQTTINLLVEAFVIPKINGYANAGIVIPMVDGVSFVNPQLTLGQGYIMISTDFNYSPSDQHTGGDLRHLIKDIIHH